MERESARERERERERERKREKERVMRGERESINIQARDTSTLVCAKNVF